MTNTVENLLKEKRLEYTTGGQDFIIKCLNPEHDDSSPSLRIDKTSGMFHCFSCGYKGNLFKHYGMLVNNTSVRIAKLKEKLAEISINSNGRPLPKGAVPFAEDYRHISKETFQHFEAFTTILEEPLLDRLCFPIKDIRGKTIVFQARHMHSSGSTKYINYPRGVELPIYPVIFDKPYHSVVLVEGLFDFLNCWDKGLKNVVCTFGTNTLQKDTALKLLPLKAQGIRKIYFMFDADDAGNSAVEKLKPLVEACDFEVEVINLEDDTDPGDLSSEYIESIREYVQQKV